MKPSIAIFETDKSIAAYCTLFVHFHCELLISLNTYHAHALNTTNSSKHGHLAVNMSIVMDETAVTSFFVYAWNEE